MNPRQFQSSRVIQTKKSIPKRSHKLKCFQKNIGKKSTKPGRKSFSAINSALNPNDYDVCCLNYSDKPNILGWKKHQLKLIMDAYFNRTAKIMYSSLGKGVNVIRIEAVKYDLIAIKGIITIGRACVLSVVSKWKVAIKLLLIVVVIIIKISSNIGLSSYANICASSKQRITD